MEGRLGRAMERPDGIVRRELPENILRQNELKGSGNMKGRVQETVEQGTIKQETVGQDTTKQETVEQDTIKQETMGQDTIKQKTVGLDTAKQKTAVRKSKVKDKADPPPKYEDCLGTLKRRLEQADAIVIGGGSGLSAAAGLTYIGRRFEAHFKKFIERYGMRDMYSAGFYPFPTQEEKWAYWSRHIYYNRYDMPAAKLYRELYEMVKNKNHFVLTTNVDHQFWLAGFQDERIFATQGDYGLFQCRQGCHKKLYDNEAQVRAMVREQKDCKIPSHMVPRCPVCGGDMEVHLRCDGNFVEDEAWHRAAVRYETFLRNNREKDLVFLELGVGMNTPGIIKYPFWRMTKQWERAFYISVNLEQAWAPDEIMDRSLVLKADIADVLEHLAEAGAGRNDGTVFGERSSHT